MPVSIVTTTNSLQGTTTAIADGEQLCTTARPTTPRVALTNAELGVFSPRYLIKNAKEVYTGVSGQGRRMRASASRRTCRPTHVATPDLTWAVLVRIGGAGAILNNVDILIQNGAIVNIAANITDPGANIIDATGKYITPGLVDLHRYAHQNAARRDRRVARTAAHTAACPLWIAPAAQPRRRVRHPGTVRAVTPLLLCR